MPHMTEREWRTFANRKNLDPETGKKTTDESPEWVHKSVAELNEWWETAKPKRWEYHPPKPGADIGFLVWPLGVAYIAMLCTAGYFIGRLFGGW
jgi:hypothetical protein